MAAGEVVRDEVVVGEVVLGEVVLGEVVLGEEVVGEVVRGAAVVGGAVEAGVRGALDVAAGVGLAERVGGGALERVGTRGAVEVEVRCGSGACTGGATTAGRPPMYARGGNCRTGSPCRAAAVYCRHTPALMRPPVAWVTPSILIVRGLP